MFENNTNRTVHTKCYLPTAEVTDYNVMKDRQYFFDQPVKNNLITCDDIWRIAIGQRDDFTTGFLLD